MDRLLHPTFEVPHMSSPIFAQLHLDEMRTLMDKGATKSAIVVYIVIAAHDWNKTGTAFPSIRTISKLCSMSERTTYKGLLWLKENKLIQQQHRTSKKRFVLLVRRGLSWVRDTTKQAADKSMPSRAIKHARAGSVIDPTKGRKRFTRHTRNKKGHSTYQRQPQPEVKVPIGVSNACYIWMEAVRHSESLERIKSHSSYKNVPKDITPGIIEGFMNGTAKSQALSMLISR